MNFIWHGFRNLHDIFGVQCFKGPREVLTYMIPTGRQIINKNDYIMMPFERHDFWAYHYKGLSVCFFELLVDLVCWLSIFQPIGSLQRISLLCCADCSKIFNLCVFNTSEIIMNMDGFFLSLWYWLVASVVDIILMIEKITNSSLGVVRNLGDAVSEVLQLAVDSL